MSVTMDTGKSRLFFLEAMKALCVFFVFFFHLTRLFDAEDWHVKDPNHTQISYFYLYEIGMAIMPAFFFVSGGSLWYSMQKRSVTTLLKNIIKRFFLPLVFGCVVLGCLQVYLERVSHGQFYGSLWNFIPHYFNGWYEINGNFAWYGLHLWYLVLLFVFTLTLLPFFVVGKRILCKPFFQQLTSSPLVLLLFALTMLIPGWKLHGNSFWGSRMWGGWSLFENILFFAFGFVFLSNSSLMMEKVRKLKWTALAIAVLLTLLCIYWYQTQPAPAFRSSFFTVKLVVRSFACWSWITALLGLTYQYFNKETKGLRVISQAIFPFYMLNQPVTLTLGYYLSGWEVVLPVKFIIIGLASFVGTIMLYAIIKQVAFLRWLFGIPQKKEAKAVNKLLMRVKHHSKQADETVFVQES